MPVTDLTGTTWTLNDTITFSYSLGLPNISSFNFTSNNTSFYGFYFDVEGESDNSLGYRTNQEYSFNQIYNSGGNIISGKEAYKTIFITGGTDATNTGLISWLEANATQQTATSKLSVDLTTLSGWANLAPGNHTIKIVAKGTGYRDSEKSAGVEVTKPVPVYTDCLTFTGKTSEFTLNATNKTWDGTLQWSTDHNTWTTLNGTEAMQSVDKKLYLRGKNNTKFRAAINGAYRGVQWQLSEKADCTGNIQTLLDWENPPTSINTNYCYASMFQDCTNLTSAPELPTTTLANFCYSYMFQRCINLTTTPELPATTLTLYCYDRMFEGCTSLTTAPELPATTLKERCYYSMFNGCTNLTSAPTLNVNSLSKYCCYTMFKGCSKLKVNTSSGTKIFTCPSTIPENAVYGMFQETGGTFTGTPTAGNTYYWTE